MIALPEQRRLRLVLFSLLLGAFVAFASAALAFYWLIDQGNGNGLRSRDVHTPDASGYQVLSERAEPWEFAFLVFVPCSVRGVNEDAFSQPNADARLPWCREIRIPADNLELAELVIEDIANPGRDRAALVSQDHLSAYSNNQTGVSA